MPNPWQFIPSTVIDLGKRLADANSWAEEQRRQLADSWANAQHFFNAKQEDAYKELQRSMQQGLQYAQQGLEPVAQLGEQAQNIIGQYTTPGPPELGLTLEGRPLLRRSKSEAMREEIKHRYSPYSEEGRQNMIDMVVGAIGGPGGQAPKAVGQMVKSTLGGELLTGPGKLTKHLYEMSADELDTAYQQVRAYEKNLDVETFGAEGAKRYKELQKISNSSRRSRAELKAADDEIERMEATLTEDQYNRFFGIGEEYTSLEDISSMRNRIGSLDWESPTLLGRSLKWAVTNIGEQSDPALMTSTEQEAYAVLRHAFQVAKSEGWDTSVITDAAIQAAASQYRDPEDAVFMLRPMIEKLASTVKPTVAKSAKQLTTGQTTHVSTPLNELSLGPGSPANVGLFPGLPTNATLLERAYQNDNFRKLGDLFSNPITKGAGEKLVQAIGLPARNVFTEGKVIQETIKSILDSNAIGVMSTLNKLGKSKDVFKNITAPRGDVLEKPALYNLNPKQAEYAETIQGGYNQLGNALTSEGIKMPHLEIQDGNYVGRRVMHRVDPVTGEVTVGHIGEGPHRVGSEAAFLKDRWFTSEAEGIKEGYKYYDPEDAFALNIKAAGQMIADKRLADHVLGYLTYRTASVPEELLLSRDHALDRLKAVGNLASVVSRAGRGERIPVATIRSIGSHYPEQAQQLMDTGIIKTLNTVPEEGQGLWGKPQTVGIGWGPESAGGASNAKQVLENIRGDKGINLKLLKAEAKADYYRARDALSLAKELAGRAQFGEATVQAPAFAGKFFSSSDATKLQQVLDLNRPSPLRGAAQSVSYLQDLPRVLMTQFDIGAPFIQGLPILLNKPTVWTKALARGWQDAIQPTNFQGYLSTHRETIQRMSNYGSLFHATDYSAASQPGRFESTKPILKQIGQVIKAAQRNYEGFFTAAKIYGWEALEHRVKTDKDGFGLARHLDELTGQASTGRQGVNLTQRHVETAALFAPRYLRASIALVSDIARGDLRGALARGALAKFTLSGTALYLGTAAALGQEAKLDPGVPSEFMTVEVAGQRIGLGSQIFMLGRLSAAMALDPGKAHEVALKFLGNKLAPAPGTLLNMLRFPYKYNSYFKLTKEVLGRNMLPIWMQQMLLEDTDLSGAIIGGVVEFIGGRTFPANNQPIRRYAPGMKPNAPSRNVPSKTPGTGVPASRYKF